MAIDLALDSTQLARQAAAHDLFEERCPPGTVRELENAAPGYDRALWQEMADRGWLGLTLPEAHGGGGGGLLDVLPLHEELGRFLVPSPLLDTVAVAGDLVARVGTEDQRRQVLPAMAAGRCIVSGALVEPDGSFGPRGVATSAVRRGQDFVLNGVKLLVGFAPDAEFLLCAARTGAGSASRDGLTVFLVETPTAGIRCAPLPNIAGSALYEVGFDDVVVPESGVVGEVGSGWEQLSVSATKAGVLQTATIVGAARAVLAMTNRYAKEREQFGSPIGQYQAVQYMVTDVLIDLHAIDLLARQAAYCIDAGKPFAREAAIAIAHGKKAAAHLHRQAHEVHAGAGFMRDHDLNLFSRRSKFWENNLGDARYHQEQITRALTG
jgi:alkylation response protein AidB-like acyl-CoA dehydrogenase